VASKAGARDLLAHFDLDPAPTAVADGEELSVGGTTLRFFETRMLHWPDSMFTWYAEDGVLFTQDAFGMHLACARPFADELIDQTSLRYEAAKYFANILLPFAPLVLKLAERLKELNLPLSVIAPDHGPVWRRPEDRGWIVGSYAHWAAQRPTPKAVVVCDTMWGSTEKMARAIVEGLVAGGAAARLLRLGASHRSDAATELLEAGALLVGSPTMNNQLLPTIADALTYLRGLRPKNKLGAVFGSYGWSGEAPKQAAEILEAMQVELVGEPLRVKYVPRAEDLERCRALGLAVAERLTAAGRAAG
jgi:flavorubredoxin